METKFDKLKRNNEERTKREENIVALTDELTEARILLRVLNNNGATDYETQQERATVHGRVKQLSELIEDEKRAIQDLDGGAADAIAEKMNI